MKTKIILTLLITTLTACFPEQNNVLSEDDAVLKLNGGSSGMLVTKSDIIELPASTAVGVYAVETGKTPKTLITTPFKNYQYTATGSMGAFTSDSPIILKKDRTYTACAYAPYQNNQNLDISAVPFNHGVDLLYAPSLPIVISGQVASASMLFEHKMSQIEVRLRPGFGAPNMEGVIFRLTGFYESGTLNLQDGTLTPVLGNGAEITQTNTPICFVPSELPMELHISATTSDKREYTGIIHRTFLPSNSYNYLLTLNKENPQIEISSSVVDWTPVNGGGPVIVTRE